MRISEAVVAICGDAATGKTTVAVALAEALNCERRHCGEEVRRAASEAGIAPTQLPEAIHREIDARTREWASRVFKPAVVDGTFLDVVLDCVPSVARFRLVCRDEVRAQRFLEQQKERRTDGDLQTRMTQDAELRSRLYGSAAPQELTTELDTSNMSVGDVVSAILSVLQQ